MNWITCSVHLSHETPSGTSISNDCGPAKGSVWTSAPSARTGKTGGSMIGAVPQGVLFGVTGGSSVLRRVWKRAKGLLGGA